MEQDPRKWKRTSWQTANTIPCEPGCYALIDSDDNILYIGQSKILWKRLHNPTRHTGFKRAKQSFESLNIAWNCGWDVYDSEKFLIQKWKPPLCQELYKRKG